MTKLDKTDARQGETGHNVRIVLVTSVILAVIGLAGVAIWIA